MGKSFLDKLLIFFSWTCTLLLVGSVSIIIGFLLIKGYRAISLELIFADTRPLDALFFK